MARIKYGVPGQEVSGTIGGVTFWRGYTGKFCKAWRPPTNKMRPGQCELRSYLAAASGRWYDVLTQGERDNWETYAATCAFTDPLGDTYYINGFNMYIRIQVARLWYGGGALTFEDTAPVGSGFGVQYTTTWLFTHATGTVDLQEMLPDPPADLMMLWTRRQVMRASRNYPWGVVLASAYAVGLDNHPGYTITSYATPLPGVAGSIKMNFAYRLLDTDNRLSEPLTVIQVSE